MNFLVVTPVFNGGAWLRACLASVAAQAAEGLHVHHHVQDGCSSDDTLQICRDHNHRSAGRDNYRFTFHSAADAGMYDAINRGWEQADTSVDWLSWLNADEQYQPGALTRVARAGTRHPGWGAIAGNCLIVKPDGSYISSRKPNPGALAVCRILMPAFTCALFIRTPAFREAGVRFDPTWRSLGDKLLLRSLVEHGFRIGHLDEYLALFVHGETNLGYTRISVDEKQRYWRACLTPLQRRTSGLVIAYAKAVRAARYILGRRCRGYTFRDGNGDTRTVSVQHETWRYRLAPKWNLSGAD